MSLHHLLAPNVSTEKLAFHFIIALLMLILFSLGTFNIFTLSLVFSCFTIISLSILALYLFGVVVNS